MSSKPIEGTSRDGIIIGLVDAIITIAVVLNERLNSEAKRMRKSSVEWEWFSEDVQNALGDLGDNKALRELLFPRDERAMRIIRDAAARLDDLAPAAPPSRDAGE